MGLDQGQKESVLRCLEQRRTLTAVASELRLPKNAIYAEMDRDDEFRGSVQRLRPTRRQPRYSARPGPPRKLTEGTRTRLLRVLTTGATMADAARSVGVTDRTVQREMRRDEVFARNVLAAREPRAD